MFTMDSSKSLLSVDVRTILSSKDMVEFLTVVLFVVMRLMKNCVEVCRILMVGKLIL